MFVSSPVTLPATSIHFLPLFCFVSFAFPHFSACIGISPAWPLLPLCCNKRQDFKKQGTRNVLAVSPDVIIRARAVGQKKIAFEDLRAATSSSSYFVSSLLFFLLPSFIPETTKAWLKNRKTTASLARSSCVWEMHFGSDTAGKEREGETKGEVTVCISWITERSVTRIQKLPRSREPSEGAGGVEEERRRRKRREKFCFLQLRDTGGGEFEARSGGLGARVEQNLRVLSVRLRWVILRPVAARKTSPGTETKCFQKSEVVWKRLIKKFYTTAGFANCFSSYMQPANRKM